MFQYSVYSKMTPELASKLAKAKGVYLTEEGKRHLQKLLKENK